MKPNKKAGKVVCARFAAEGYEFGAGCRNCGWPESSHGLGRHLSECLLLNGGDFCTCLDWSPE